MTASPSLNRVANNGQLTPSQETVGQRLLGHAVIPTFFEAALQEIFCIPRRRAPRGGCVSVLL